MVAFQLRKIAKLIYLPLFTAGILFAPSSGVFSRPISGDPISAGHAPVALSSAIHPTVLVSTTPSAFDKEQAMSPKELMDRWVPLIKEASHRFKVSEAWIEAVMRMESGGRTLLDDSRPITSNAGAMGIMQIMPNTYQDMRQRYGLGADPYDPRDNVLAGAAYLHWLYEKYGFPKLFAAYNAGPGTLEAQSAGARKLPSETRDYVSDIARLLGTDSNPAQATNAPAPPIDPIATLTRPDGSAASIDGAAVDSIRASLPNEYAPGVQTVVAMGNKRQGVREDLATVASVIRSHGGKI